MKHFDIRRWIAGALLAVTALAAPVGAHAQSRPQPRLTPAAAAKNPNAKLVYDLVQLEQEYQTYASRKSARQGPFTPTNRLFQLQQGQYVAVDAVAETSTLALQRDLAALGAKGAVAFGRMVSSFVPIDRIGRLQELRSLRFARPAYRLVKEVGLVTSQGDSAQRSGLARSKYNLSGKTAKVGVLSDSYNQLVGARGGVLTGDLPGPENPNGYKKPVQVLAEAEEFATDEGRAMLEIIHDVAPGAELAFHTANGGEAAFASGIVALKDSGCNVIVDDVIYLAEPFFQDGLVSQAVNQVAKEGAVYFSAAGNRGRDAYEKAFQPSGKEYVSGNAHSFAPGDELLRVFIPQGEEVIFILQWSDPFFSVSGKGASTDLSMYLLNDAATQLLDVSAFPSLGNDPIEAVIFTNNGPDGFFNLLIEKESGPDPELLKVIGYGLFALAEHRTNSSTLVGHKNAAGAIAVGAVRYNRTPAFGVAEPRPESFSSAGGTPLLFDELGNKIAPIVFRKPEVMAPNGGNTTFFFPRQDLEGDGFPNFFGTSASAPHAAAVAALMLEATANALQPDQVRQVLQETALDMDDPFTQGSFDEGFDFGTGYGLIQADKAVERVLGTPLVQRFVLVNADNGEDIDEIQEGDVINLATLPTRNLNIRAVTAPATVGSVVFDLDGKKTTENLAPYALAGDFANNPVKYRILTPALSPGDYKLSAVPYTEDNGDGTAGFALTVSFRVVESAVTSFVLVDADTGDDLLQIEDQAVINLNELPRRLNIRANTVPARVGSVVFEYNEFLSPPPGLKVTENLPPYALGGDFYSQPAKYRILADSLVDEGIYSLLATPYEKEGGKGAAGQPLRVLFLLSADTMDVAALPTVDVAGNKLQTAQPGVEALSAAAPRLGVYPNPTTGKLRVQTAKGGTLTLYNAKGERVYGYQAPGATTQVDLSTLPNGLYLLRVQEEGTTRTVRVVKRAE